MIDQDVIKALLPEVEDITSFQVTQQGVLIEPAEETTIKTKGGIIIGGVDADKVRNGLLQRGKIISVGSKVEDLKPGQEVFFYKSAVQGMIKSKEIVYLLYNDNNILAFLK